MSQKNKSNAPVVAVLNMKGGVGKTTISAHVFGLLWERKKASTLLLDLDPQFNLTQTLYEAADYDQLHADGKTILKVLQPAPLPGLFGVTNASAPPPPIQDVVATLEAGAGGADPLAIVPGDFELTKYTLITEARRLKAVQERFLTFVETARESFKAICIDCNPSSSFLTLCALLPCTHLLVPVRADRYSVRGLEMLVRFLDEIPLLIRKPKIGILMNGVKRGAAVTDVEKEIRRHSVFGSQVFAARIPHSELLVATSDYTGFASQKPVAYRRKLENDLSTVVDEIAPWMGL